MIFLKDKESMLTLVKKIDSSNGYVFGGKHEEGNLSEMLSYAAGADFEYFKYPLRLCVSFIVQFCLPRRLPLFHRHKYVQTMSDGIAQRTVGFKTMKRQYGTFSSLGRVR
jgi:hypothetical protein